MKIRDAYEEYQFSILSHSEATQEWTRKKLGRFISWCEVQGLEVEDIKPMEVRRFIEELKAHQTNTTVSLLYQATRYTVMLELSERSLIGVSMRRS